MHLLLLDQSERAFEGEELPRAVASLVLTDHREVWVVREEGPALACLISGEVGLLVFLRFQEDHGFHTVNPAEPSDRPIDFLRGNGQRDTYPAHKTYPLAVVREALREFAASGTRPTNVNWVESL